MKEAAPKAIFLKEYQEYPYIIESVSLNIQLHEDLTIVTAELDMRRNPAHLANGSGEDCFLNGEQLLLRSIAINSEALLEEQYEVTDEGLLLHNPPSLFRLTTEVEIHPEQNRSLEGLYQSSGNFCTQCEAEGFRKITFYPDRPDVLSIFTVTLEADQEKYPVLLSNGNLVESYATEKGRHAAKWLDPHRKPCYLFAMVAGDLALTQGEFTTQSGREVKLAIYTEHHNADKTQHAVASLQRAMRWDEKVYGLTYDLDVYMIVAVDDFNMGAMENKGLNIFNSKYVLANPDTATDTDYINIEAVIAHEYFHNWTGNRVTCRDWFQLSLKEGLTVFRDQSFTADMTSAAVKRIDDVRALRTHQFAEDASPMAHPVRPASYIEINNFYTLTVYEKGAEVVRMYQTLLGKKGFRKGMNLYFKRHDGEAVTTDDFRNAMADANNADLSQFQNWYTQAGTPEVEITDDWDEQAGRYLLHCKQTCPPTPEAQSKLPFLIPIKLGLLDRNGKTLQVDGADEQGNILCRLTEPEQIFEFTGLAEKPTASLFREFSAPVKWQFPYSDEALAFLMSHDQDLFNRWDAGQTLIMKNILAMIAQIQAGADPVANPILLTAFGRLLNQTVSDYSLLAESLSLPDAGLIAEQMAEVDVDAIALARRALKQQLAAAYPEQWRHHYELTQDVAEFSLEATAIGKRRLHNLALDYLAATGDTDALDLALEQYQTATTMTASLGALQVLKNHDSEQLQYALQAFESRWQSDALVMDKWFTVQATAEREDALEQVQQLLQHASFALTNPNKVRALIGAFIQANPTGFHRKDGAGYEFAKQQILAIDSFNPQIAARLAKVFSRWRRYDEQRQQMMKGCLQAMSEQKNLSADLYEVVSNSLDK
jgi:aminopeptidase N